LKNSNKIVNMGQECERKRCGQGKRRGKKEDRNLGVGRASGLALSFSGSSQGGGKITRVTFHSVPSLTYALVSGTAVQGVRSRLHRMPEVSGTFWNF
jgi:hypothetical protein